MISYTEKDQTVLHSPVFFILKTVLKMCTIYFLFVLL